MTEPPRAAVGRKPARAPLTLLSRPGCHLCEEFREALHAVFPEFELHEQCVDDRPAWRGLYGHRIPVLLSGDGTPICEGFFDRERFMHWVAAAR